MGESIARMFGKIWLAFTKHESESKPRFPSTIGMSVLWVSDRDAFLSGDMEAYSRLSTIGAVCENAIRGGGFGISVSDRDCLDPPSNCGTLCVNSRPCREFAVPLAGLPTARQKIRRSRPPTGWNPCGRANRLASPVRGSANVGGSRYASNGPRQLRHLEEDLRDLAELDSHRQNDSYGLVRIISWPCPCLDFSDTVIGISETLGQMDMKQLASGSQEAMNSLTAGLYVAFDTTAVGLVLTMLALFAMFGVSVSKHACSESLMAM